MMFADPEPEKAIGSSDRQRAVVQCHSRRPDFIPVALPDLLESQRRMFRIHLQQGELLISPRSRVDRQRIIKGPEPAIGFMRHPGV